MLCRLTDGGTSFPLSAEDYVYPETGTDRPKLPIVATSFPRNIVNKFDFERSASKIFRSFVDAVKLYTSSSLPDRAPIFLPVDISTIELTISFCTPGFGKLSNTLMPLSSLAAEPARITIPNEPARGESNFFQPFSLSFFPPSRICPPPANLILSFLTPTTSLAGNLLPPGGGRESQIKINKFVCIANAGLRKGLWVERDDREYWLTRICNFNYVPWRDVQDWG